MLGQSSLGENVHWVFSVAAESARGAYSFSSSFCWLDRNPSNAIESMYAMNPTQIPARGRFAPSPTGRMHAGNIFSALMMWLVVKSQGGTIVLRIEDLDRERSKREYIDQVQRDFELLGLTWDEGPYFQSTEDPVYEEAFLALQEAGMVYPCYCTRADLKAASAPHWGEKNVYPGYCRDLNTEERYLREEAGRRPAWRLRVPDEMVEFRDLFQGDYRQLLDRECGDFVVRRSDDLFAYQLAVVADDARQGINTIVRGIDLITSTPQQIYLRRLLGKLGVVDPGVDPVFGHIPLLMGEDGHRLSKRHKDASLDMLMETYKTSEAVLGHVAFVTGMIDEDVPATPEALLKVYDPAKLAQLWRGKEGMVWR